MNKPLLLSLVALAVVILLVFDTAYAQRVIYLPDGKSFTIPDLSACLTQAEWDQYFKENSRAFDGPPPWYGPSYDLCEGEQADVEAGSVAVQSEGITVFGTLEYTPWKNYGVTIEEGVPHALVCVYDYNNSTKGDLSKWSPVYDTAGNSACAYTDSDGDFSISDVNPSDPDNDGTRIDVGMRFYHATDEHGNVFVAVGSVEEIAFSIPYRTLGDDETEFDASYTSPYDTQQNHALGVYDAIHDALRFFGVADADVVAHIVNEKCAEVGGSPSHCYWWTNHNRTSGVIGISGTYGDANDRWAVLHEMGHYMMDHSMGTNRPTPPSNGYCGNYVEYLHETSNDECAWTEGWAFFVPHMVDDRPRLNDIGLYNYYEMEEGYYQSGSKPLNFNNVRSSDPLLGWLYDWFDLKDGSILGGAVAAALYDMVDNNNHNDRDYIRGDLYDGISVDISKIVSVMSKMDTLSVRDFYADWQNTYSTDTSNVMTLHNIISEDLVLFPVTVEATGYTTPISFEGLPSSITASANVTNLSLGTHTVSWIFTDGTGSLNATQVITVQDTTQANLTTLDVSAGISVVSAQWLPPLGTPPSFGTPGTPSPFTQLIHRDETGFDDDDVVFAVDSVDDDVTLTHDAPVYFPLGTTIVNWKAIDDSGNVATSTQSVTIVDPTTDKTPPVITAPHRTIEATGKTTPVNTSWITVSDDKDNSPRITYKPSSVPLGNSTISWTVIDHNNNVAKATQTVTIQDTTPPNVTAPPDITHNTNTTYTPIEIGMATATDLVDDTITITHDATIQAGQTVFPVGTTIVTWTATDISGNVGIDTQNVTVSYDPNVVLPTITPPPDITQEATGKLTAVNIGVATVNDTSYIITNNAPSGFPVGATIVTWTATGPSGIVTAAQTITIQDTTPPLILAPSDVTQEATGNTTLVIFGDPTVSDLVDDDPRIRYSLLYSSSDNIEDSSTINATGYVQHDVTAVWFADMEVGVYYMVWTATDYMGNSASDTQRITVQDTTPPALSIPPDMVVASTGTTTKVVLEGDTYSATDLVDPDPDIWLVTERITDNITGQATTSLPPMILHLKLGTHAVTWYAEDLYGNQASAVQNITVTEHVPDTTPPTITAPADITQEATGYRTSVNLGTATATDDTDLSPTITNNAPSTFPIGTTIVTWTATDNSGNAGTDTQRVTIQDTTPPNITQPPHVTKEATGYTTYVNFGTATATDLVDSSPTIYYSLVSPEFENSELESPLNFTEATTQAGGYLTVGVHKVYWRATDNAGNTANAPLQIITVQDTTDPTITIPSDLTKEATGYTTYVNYGTATATDLVDSSPTITYNTYKISTDIATEGLSDDEILDIISTSEEVVSDDATAQAGGYLKVGTYWIWWKATDDSGNYDSGIQTIKVRDTTPPTISSKSDIHRGTSYYYGVVVTYANPTATDTVDSSVSVSCSPPSGSTFYVGTTTVTCRATDNSGNTASTTFNVIVTNYGGLGTNSTNNSTNNNSTNSTNSTLSEVSE